MVFRAVLAIWLLASSVFAPAMCCCAPIFGSTAQAETAQQPIQTAPAKQPCTHCKKSTPLQDAAPKEQGKHSCPADPSRNHCPCQDHVLASALVITNDSGVNLSANRPIDFLPFCVETFFHGVVSKGESRTVDYTGPPPIAGVELLHRLHILNC